MNLYQKIVEVRKEAKGFYKDKKSFNYSYVTGNQILEKIRDKMNELNLLLIPSAKLGEHHTHEYVTGKGTPKEKQMLDFVVAGEMSYTWIDGDKPEDTLTVGWAYYGQQDDISKAYGSALTYSERYFLLKCLGLPTDEDDPDGKEEVPQDKPKQEQGKPKPFTKGTSSSSATKELCTSCKADINQAVKAFSEKKYGKALCRDCQSKEKQ